MQKSRKDQLISKDQNTPKVQASELTKAENILTEYHYKDPGGIQIQEPVSFQ